MADVIILGGGIDAGHNYPKIQRYLGPYRIGTALEKHNYSVSVIDYLQYLTVEETITALSKVLTKDTLWVGFSSTFFFLGKPGNVGLTKMYQNMSYDYISKIYEYIKENSNAKIVYGGAYALQQNCDPLVDYYIVSYSDNTVIELSDYLSGKKSSIEHYNEIVNNGITSISIDSAKYPDPAMDSLQTSWHKDNWNLLPGEAVPLEFARGCIFKCKFCNYPLLGKKKGTYIRDMAEVRDELVQLWETKGTDTFYVTDDTFNDDNDKMEEFHKLFTSLPFKPKFSAFLRLDLIDRFPHQADLLLEAGMVGNFFGVETFNHKSGKAIGKGLHPDKLKSRLHWVREKWKGKVNTGIGLIIGLPYDDEKYFQELSDYVQSPDYPVQYTSFNPLFIIDKSKNLNIFGSEFSVNSEIYGYKFNDKEWYHEEQGFNFSDCKQIASAMSKTIQYKSQPADFQVITYMNLGIKLEDILKYTIEELDFLYNIPKMNDQKLMMYKQMIGAI